jgi:putative membrane protein
MKVLVVLFWLGGISLIGVLVAYQGLGVITSLFSMSGWGVLWTTLFHFLPLIAFAMSWWALFTPKHRLRFATLFYLRWICEAVNVLLPVAHVGGDVVRARLATRYGVPGPVAGATVVGDVSAGLFSEAAFAFLGLALFLQRGGKAQSARFLAGLFLFGIILFAFYLAQRWGLFRRVAQLVVRLWGRERGLALVGDGAALDEELSAIYRRGGRFLMSCGWRLLSWGLGAGEVWLALYFLRRQVTFLEALMLESLSQAARSAAFVVPGGLGVQESGFILVGNALGLESGVALTASLIKRAREICFGIPGLVAWQISEGRWLRSRQARAAEPVAVQNPPRRCGGRAPESA